MNELRPLQSFGLLLREFRIQAGFSQEELADRARVSLAAVSALERGTRRAPQRGTLALLSEGLGLGAVERDKLLDAASRSRARGLQKAKADTGLTSAKASNSPFYLTSFVAREDEIALLRKAIHDNRLLTIVGAGGIGKTRLACELAAGLNENFDRIVFADLAPLVDGEMVAPYLARILKTNVDEDGAIQAIVAVLARSRVLLIFDNCERLLEAAAATATELLKSVPNLTVLATSRERLSVSSEWIYRLQPLEAASARDLFVERARAVEPHFTFSERNAEAVADICRRLDGMPLAIELAVARLPTLGIRQLRSRLDDRFASTPGYRDAPARHQTMQATIAWSSDLLEDDERAILDRAGIFSGGFTLEAGEVVFNDAVRSSGILDILSRLVEKSLLLVTHEGDASRYRMLEPVRFFSLERLRKAGTIDDTARRHANWIADRADAANLEIRSGFSHRTIAIQMTEELDNIRAALDRLLSSGDENSVVLAARIAGGLRTVWIRLSLFEEAARLARDILAGMDVNSQPELMALMMRLQIQVLPKPLARSMFKSAVDVFMRAGDHYALCNMYIDTINHASAVGDFELAEMCDNETARLFAGEHALDAGFYAAYLSVRSYMRGLQGRFDEARAIDLAASKIQEHEATPAGCSLRSQARSQIEGFAGNYVEAIALERFALEINGGEYSRVSKHAYCNLAAFHFLNEEFVHAKIALRQAFENVWIYPQSSVLPFNLVIQVAAALAARAGAMESAARLKGCYDHHVTARKGVFRSQIEQALNGRIDAAFAARPDFAERDYFMAQGAKMTRAEARALAQSLADRND